MWAAIRYAEPNPVCGHGRAQPCGAGRRANTSTGHPVRSERFVRQAEITLKRKLAPGKGGRSKKDTQEQTHDSSAQANLFAGGAAGTIQQHAGWSPGFRNSLRHLVRRSRLREFPCPWLVYWHRYWRDGISGSSLNRRAGKIGQSASQFL